MPYLVPSPFRPFACPFPTHQPLPPSSLTTTPILLLVLLTTSPLLPSLPPSRRPFLLILLSPANEPLPPLSCPCQRLHARRFVLSTSGHNNYSYLLNNISSQHYAKQAKAAATPSTAETTAGAAAGTGDTEGNVNYNTAFAKRFINPPHRR